MKTAYSRRERLQDAIVEAVFRLARLLARIAGKRQR